MAKAERLIDEKVEQRIFDGVDEIADDMIESIRSIVQIKSVEGAPCEGAPFGAGPRAALEEALACSARLGFDTVDVDGYMGYATWRPVSPRDEGYVCALGHVDVVPEGTGWKHPAYSAHVENGTIYGRGVLDNKGPVYACLFAAAALKRQGFEPARELRVMFGCNEETGFRDLRYYLAHNEPPVMGFTPDCKYPVVYAERGRALVRLYVPSERLFAFMNEYVLNAKPTGDRLGIDCADAEFGTLEVRNYRLGEQDGESYVQFAISYPASTTCDELVSKLQALADREGVRLELVSNFDPVRFEKDCELCRCLQYAYERVTGADGTPVTTTGGTYAKMMPNIVPFGPSFPGQKGIGHQPNEWMKIDDVVANAKIYALALYLLTR